MSATRSLRTRRSESRKLRVPVAAGSSGLSGKTSNSPLPRISVPFGHRGEQEGIADGHDPQLRRQDEQHARRRLEQELEGQVVGLAPPPAARIRGRDAGRVSGLGQHTHGRRLHPRSQTTCFQVVWLVEGHQSVGQGRPAGQAGMDPGRRPPCARIKTQLPYQRRQADRLGRQCGDPTSTTSKLLPDPPGSNHTFSARSPSSSS